MKREILDAINEARAGKRAVALITSLEDGSQRVFDPLEAAPPEDVELARALADVLASDRSRSVVTGDGEVFLQVFNPPLRLVVVGAVHITQVLAPMAVLTGYQVTVVDPRRSFAAEDRFPGVDLRTDWPDEAMQALAPDARTAIVTLTHDPKIDDPALHEALRSRAFYIGCLGSPRTHASRLERLRESGFGDDDLARIHGPIGLAIGARSPEEISLSILAQITTRLRGGRVT